MPIPLTTCYTGPIRYRSVSQYFVSEHTGTVSVDSKVFIFIGFQPFCMQDHYGSAQVRWFQQVLFQLV